MRNFGADDARVWSLGTRSETPATSDCDRRTYGNTKTVKLGAETTNNIDDEKMWTSRGISTACMIQCLRSWWKKLWKLSRSFPRSIFEYSAIVSL